MISVWETVKKSVCRTGIQGSSELSLPDEVYLEISWEEISLCVSFNQHLKKTNSLKGGKYVTNMEKNKGNFIQGPKFREEKMCYSFYREITV